MRKTLLFLMLLCVKLTYGQLADDFNDGNFTANPRWLGHQNAFDINSNRQLQTRLSVSAQLVSLVTANALALNVKWEFSVQLHFDPSATNQAKIYLIADQQDLNGPLNGYFIQIGESGSTDSYDLYRQNGTNVSKIIDGLPKARPNANSINGQVRVSRDELGNWALYTATGTTNDYVLEGKTNDLQWLTTSWFGVSCKYTATRSDGFIFDNFLVEELAPDVIAPTLLSCKVIDEHQIEATFSEALEAISALNQNHYSLRGLGQPVRIEATALPTVYRLSFAAALSSGSYTLTVKQLKDLKGNEIQPNSSITFRYIKPYQAKRGDVVLNEIFADPLPSKGLPTVEFVELWNTTNEYISLDGWRYGDLNSTYTFKPSDILAPHSYVILTAQADVVLFKSYGETIGLATWPSLNNDKEVLKLLDATGNLIDEVTYTADWYKDDHKKQGGFSLELIDPKNRCIGSQNWIASRAEIGGSPGAVNTVFQSQLVTAPLQLITATILDDTHIKLTFNRHVDSLSASKTANYRLNNGIGFPLAALPQAPFFTSVLLQLSTPLAIGITNLITVDQLSDCAGNLIDPKANMATFFKAKTIQKGDVLISELLVNPKNGGVDFIELYNHSEHVLDLKTLKLGNADRAEPLTTQSTYMPAKTHWVLTSDPQNVQQNYHVEFPKQLIKMNNFPAYPNVQGRVVLWREEELIDQLDYHENMHLPLLQKADGVSLERVSYERPTAEAGNFRSAAAVVGFATPSSRNSQEENPQLLQNKVSLASKTFSPDGDGFEDLLQIDYQFINTGQLANVNIYTAQGVLVRRLQKNVSLATSGTLTWDGTDDRGQQSKVGIYVLRFDTFNLKGKAENYKQSFALAAPLN